MTKLPNLHKAKIDRRKISHYLLSREHPVGRAKAAFFEGVGFTREKPEAFEEALRNHASQNSVSEILKTEFGTKFVIDGPIHTPIGVSPWIYVKWFSSTSDMPPHLVTAYPSEPKATS
jgi:hypothetical protein